MNNYRLWYTNAAKDFTEALPFGNGSFGGMVYGRVPDEKISLNSDTLWSGTHTKEEPKIDKALLDEVRKYIFSGEYRKAEDLIEEQMLGFYNESYLPMADLYYNYEGIGVISDYKRSLYLNEGVIKTSFKSDKTKITSELFSSYPDKIIVLKINADGEEKLNLSFNLTSKLKYTNKIEDKILFITGMAPTHVEPNYVNSDNPVIYDETDKGIQFVLALRIKKTDGQYYENDDQIKVNDATFIEVEIATENGFTAYNQPLLNDINTIKAQCLSKFTTKDYFRLLADHQQDYKSLFNRVDFSLDGENPSDLPTDQRLSLLKENKKDITLYPLYFQYGRYLMIASSRPGSQASNLQGIWNEELRAPWSSNYTVNINTEMNYWMTNGANLIECAEPLVEMVQELSRQGQKTAINQFHCRGWVTNHNVDLWRQTGPVAGKAKFAYWPMGGVWLTASLFKQYLYTKDEDYLLNRLYPILKGCTLFCSDWLVEGPDGRLHTCPSTSPENEFTLPGQGITSVSYSSTMDITMIKELFHNFLTVAKQYDLDSELRSIVSKQIKALPNIQVGEDDCIQEWILPFTEVEKGHRHFTPIYGLHPRKSINTYESPELVDGALKFIEKRLKHGGGHTGWSCAWLISMYARLGEGESAFAYLTDLLTHSSYNNLFDLHPPLGEGFEGEHEVFQIDGNFGGVEGIMSMLVQSHLGEIHLLPALPKAWHSGSINGILLEGGRELSMEWKDHRLVKGTIKSNSDEIFKIKYELPIKISSNGVQVEITFDQRSNFVVVGKKGQLYNLEIKK